jgi:lipopolysaccharide transport system permease protein
MSASRTAAVTAIPSKPLVLSPTKAPILEPVAAIWPHRRLLLRFTLNDALGRYKGSLLGIAWSFLNPLLMLGVFTIAFGTIFSGANFAMRAGLPPRPPVLSIFCGMIVFAIFGEVLGRAPGCVLSNPNYVKKVVFPLEILPVALLGSSLLHALIGLCILAIGALALGSSLYWTIVLLPLVLLPLVLFGLGFGWFLGSLGVYVRDVGHTMTVVSQALFFLTPVVYPFSVFTDAAPRIAAVLAWNPLKVAVDDARLVVLWGELPDFTALTAVTAVSLLIAWLGFVWFQKTRRGFADVL